MKYIWLKDGKPWKDSKDLEGNDLIKEYYPNNVEVNYKKKTYMNDTEASYIEWTKNGLRHRDDDKPAFVNYSDLIFKQKQSENWYQNGELNRNNDKPTIIGYYENGQVYEEKWYRNGELHRDNEKPAIIRYNKDGSRALERYYENGDFVRREDYSVGYKPPL